MSKIVTKRIKRRKITKIRMILTFVFFGFIIFTLSYKLFDYLREISDIKKEKETLEGKLADLEEQEEILKTDIQKLEDPEYVAKYAREKYLYSKEGELIIRIPDSNNTDDDK